MTVRNTIVAFILHDGVPRVIERNFGNARLNAVRNLARAHLGMDSGAQQQRADERGDVERMSADGFRQYIWRVLERVERGSKFNDFPADMTVWEYNERMKRPAPAEPWRGGQRWIYPPNPTTEYPEARRREWAGVAARYLGAFRERFPAEYALWGEHQRHVARREPGSFDVRPGDRVAFWWLNRLQPAIVLVVEDAGPEITVDLRTEEREFRRWNAWPNSLVPAARLFPETRELWAPIWDQLEVVSQP